MNVPFIDLKAQLKKIRSEIERRFSNIIDNTAFVCGREVQKFEGTFSQLHEVKFAVGSSSGTDGNHIAMLSCDIGKGDDVIVPVNTFIATAEAISHSGATPVFIDVNEKTYNIDVDQIEERITPNSKAINPVHLFGQPADLKPIKEIANKKDIFVVEDAAQAHLAEYSDRKVGGIGQIASWSFYPGKNLGAWGEAGAVTTNDEKMYLKAKKMRDHGSGKKYYHDLIGHNYRMSEFQAAVLNVKMKYIENWTEMRRKNAEAYSERLADIEQVITPSELKNVKHVYHLYVIRAENRDELQNFLKENGVASGLHYPIPLHLTQAYAHLGYKKGDFPVAEKLANEILSLPMYPELAEEQIDYVCEKIKAFYKS
ncbi:MAG: DegT/DnrJ/EryC1/StrS family aminotransferase [Candidatus Hodarchaeales archaeon]|jgi:dTDP-4-amino-4,6-dideoxygalactose transaminase